MTFNAIHFARQIRQTVLFQFVNRNIPLPIFFKYTTLVLLTLACAILSPLAECNSSAEAT
jgi:hypothetical protein